MTGKNGARRMQRKMFPLRQSGLELKLILCLLFLSAGFHPLAQYSFRIWKILTCTNFLNKVGYIFSLNNSKIL